MIIVLCSCLLSLAAYAKPFKNVTFYYPPMMDQNELHGGLMGEIVRAAFHEVQIETDLAYLPAKCRFVSKLYCLY